MANRHLSRSIVVQTLFEWDFAERDDSELDDILARNIAEFGPGLDEDDFMEKLLKGVVHKKSALDDIITKAAPDWPIDKIATVDRNILRIGLFELLFSDRGEVPPKVAINEAIELAKGFGGETSGKFVNGVLGSVYREIGEPGKEQISQKKKDVPYEEMEVDRLAGAVVYARQNGEIYFALVHDIFGHWTLSKGGIDKDESPEAGVVREIKEELSLDIVVKERLGENEYIASDPERGKIRKQVIYFLAESPFVDISVPADKGGLDDADWFKISEILDLNFYDDVMPLVTKAVTILLGGGTKAE